MKVLVQSCEKAPSPQLPSALCSASTWAPQPSVATLARSAATTSAGASVRSRMTCHRIAGSASSSQSTTVIPGTSGSTFNDMHRV